METKIVRFVILVCFTISLAFADDIVGKIYVNVINSTHCFKILNGTHEIGCQSSMSGNVGIIQLVRTNEDIEYMKNDPDSKGTFIASFRLDKHFNQSLLLEVKDLESVQGVIIMFKHNDTLYRPNKYTDDHSCPNPKSGLYPTTGCGDDGKEWNEHGLGLWFHNWPKPVFLVKNDTEVDYVEKCFADFNENAQSWPYCGAQLSFRMIAAGSAVSCLRRSQLFAGLSNELNEVNCDPLGGENLYAFVPPTNKSVDSDYETFVISAKMDGIGMFDSDSPSVTSVYAPLVLFHLVAHTIGAALRTQSGTMIPNRHLLFTLFNGESLDYIGSSRMVYDMERNLFPDPNRDFARFKLKNIAQFIEIDQFDGLDSSKYYAHFDKTNYLNSNFKSQIDSLIKGLGAEKSDRQFLPPSSVQSFLKQNDTVFPAVVISDYNDQYNNKYFHSVLDRSDVLGMKRNNLKIKFESLASKISALAMKWLFEQFKTTTLPDIDETILDQLLDCYVFAGRCDAFRKIVDAMPFDDPSKRSLYFDQYFKMPYTSYIGPNNSGPVQVSVITSRYLLPFFLGQTLGGMAEVNRSDCKADTFGSHDDSRYSYDWIPELFDQSKQNRSYCIKSTVQTHVAVSPAFEIEDYDLTSGQYSTWVESRWGPYEIRLFLKPKPVWGIGVLLLGLVVFVVSMVGTFFVNKHSDLLFVGAADDIVPVAL